MEKVLCPFTCWGIKTLINRLRQPLQPAFTRKPWPLHAVSEFGPLPASCLYPQWNLKCLLGSLDPKAILVKTQFHCEHSAVFLWEEECWDQPGTSSISGKFLTTELHPQHFCCLLNGDICQGWAALCHVVLGILWPFKLSAYGYEVYSFLLFKLINNFQY
jgi:hypothetical protein